jgi:hypothetical protein
MNTKKLMETKEEKLAAKQEKTEFMKNTNELKK